MCPNSHGTQNWGTIEIILDFTTCSLKCSICLKKHCLQKDMEGNYLTVRSKAILLFFSSLTLQLLKMKQLMN